MQKAGKRACSDETPRGREELKGPRRARSAALSASARRGVAEIAGSKLKDQKSTITPPTRGGGEESHHGSGKRSEPTTGIPKGRQMDGDATINRHSEKIYECKRGESERKKASAKDLMLHGRRRGVSSEKAPCN